MGAFVENAEMISERGFVLALYLRGCFDFDFPPVDFTPLTNLIPAFSDAHPV